MGNTTFCLPRSKHIQTVSMDTNGLKRSRKSQRSKVSALTYKDTWSSFLKTVQSEKLPFFPTKSPPQRRSTVRFIRSWDDDIIAYHRKIQHDNDKNSKARRRHTRSASPRRRNSIFPTSKTISKIEGRALREAWLHEAVWPTFGNSTLTESCSKVGKLSTGNDRLEIRSSLKDNLKKCKGTNSSNERDFYADPWTRDTSSDVDKKPTKGDSLEANPSSDSSDIHLTPDSLEVNAVSTITTTTDSLRVNATSSSPTSSLDSMSPFCCSSSIKQQSTLESSHSLLQTSSTSANTSTRANVSSSDNSFLEKSVLEKRGNNRGNSANRRRILNDKHEKMSSSSKTVFQDPYREYWTKEYLYNLDTPLVLPQRSASFIGKPKRSNMENRLWQSTPDLRRSKSQERVLSDLKREKLLEEEAYRKLRRKTRSLTLLKSSSMPRLRSASRSRASSRESRESLPKARDTPRDDRHPAKQRRDSGKARTQASQSRLDVIDRLELDYYRSKSARPKSAKHEIPHVSLQPASGDNKASVLRKTITKKRMEDSTLRERQLRDKEKEKRQRWRSIRLDPAWNKVAGGGGQALQDIASRKCYKEYIERQRMLKFNMDMEDMLNRVWQMPPLFAREGVPEAPKSVKERSSRRNSSSTKIQSVPHIVKTSPVDSPGPQQNNRFLSTDTLQLSRPSTAKSSSRSLKAGYS